MNGLFETIRVRAGRIEFLSEHLDRLARACHTRGFSFPSRDYEMEIRALLEERGLTNQLVRVRIVVTHEGVALSAEMYTPLPRTAYREGIRLMRVAHPEPSAQARFKRTERHNYERVLEDARGHGFDECLLCHEGRILEGATTNVLVSNEGVLHIPLDADFRLHGIMEQAVIRESGLTIIEGPITWPLPPTVRIFMTSSLKGIVPVRSVDGVPFFVDAADVLAPFISRWWPYDD